VTDEERRDFLRAWYNFTVAIWHAICHHHQRCRECGHEDCRISTEMSAECWRSRGNLWLFGDELKRRMP